MKLSFCIKKMTNLNRLILDKSHTKFWTNIKKHTYSWIWRSLQWEWEERPWWRIQLPQYRTTFRLLLRSYLIELVGNRPMKTQSGIILIFFHIAKKQAYPFIWNLPAMECLQKWEEACNPYSTIHDLHQSRQSNLVIQAWWEPQTRWSKQRGYK